MKRELKYSLRLSEHSKEIFANYFEIRVPFLEAFEEWNAAEYRAYIRDVITDRPSYSELTGHQKYLHDLGGLIAPILSAYRLRIRIPRLKPRTYSVTASARLEECGQLLAMAAFHFKERIKLFGKSAAVIVIDTKQRNELQVQIGRIVRNYSDTNKRLMKFRNFIVHGPEGREDEFADIRSCELGGIFLHNDLWFEYNTQFEQCKAEWTTIAKELIGSMEIAIAEVQALNERLIQEKAFDFVSRQKQRTS